ncbi:flagellar biosynthetic protein FliO [Thalassoglobus polymorphus]|uniref:Flagellar biosynthesis protein, FliO n=1 Tax=Thalassoglobus polymorphus TaxID=2527994 RepID=A0A517QPL8_9PLAN|nr:hypothetical protein [Thalassoglobus polymorphus]QDT33576.1 hypothetical protein Mal48_28290 [Thalassoglobus polymorphus]
MIRLTDKLCWACLLLVGVETTLAVGAEAEKIPALEFNIPQTQTLQNVELWYGSQLSEPELPTVEWLQDEEMNWNQTFKSIAALTLSKTETVPEFEATDRAASETQAVKRTPEQAFKQEIAASTFASTANFAEPLDFDLWNLVKWTGVVLFIAGLSTYVVRMKQGVILQKLNMSDQKKLKTNELTHLSTLSVHQNSLLHLVMLGDERYLIATDPSGVKSVTLVPNWNLDENEDLESSGVTADQELPQTLAISEVS